MGNITCTHMLEENYLAEQLYQQSKLTIAFLHNIAFSSSKIYKTYTYVEQTGLWSNKPSCSPLPYKHQCLVTDHLTLTAISHGEPVLAIHSHNLVCFYVLTVSPVTFKQPVFDDQSINTYGNYSYKPVLTVHNYNIFVLQYIHTRVVW